MIVLALVMTALAGTAAYITGREARAALEARPRDRHGILRRPAPHDDAPARHQSLDASSRTCSHSTRPAAVVPYAHNAPVAWVCPDCDATVPEPPPLGPAPEPDDGSFISFIHPLRGPGARSDRDTAPSLSGTVSTGSTTITANRITAGTITADRLFPPPPPGGPFQRVAADGVSPATGSPTDVYAPRRRPALADERHSIRQALDHAEDRVRALSDALETDDNGHFVISKDQYRAYSAACASVKELRAHLNAMPELPETYEVRSHQSDAPLARFTDGPASITYANHEADRARFGAYLAAQADQIARGLTVPGSFVVATERSIDPLDRLGRGWPIDPSDDIRPL